MHSRVLLMTLVSAISACGGNAGSGGGGTPAPPAAPAPPGATTMTMDLSVTSGGLNLDDEGGQGLVAPEDAATNHLEASSFILVVNDDLATPLALPVALLDGAPAVKGQLQADQTWIRSYDVSFGNRKWTTNLSSVQNADQSLDWSLRVTAQPADANGCCTDFELAAGSSPDGGTGTWTINDLTHPTEALPLFTVVYAVRGTDDKTLTFTVSELKPSALRFGGGSTLGYTVSGDAVTMAYQDAADDEIRTIAWKRSSQAGSYTDPMGQKLCWLGKDQNYVNGSCN